jgi:hypothetical protein
VNILLIPVILAAVFALPFLMAWIEPTPGPPSTHREDTSRR